MSGVNTRGSQCQGPSPSWRRTSIHWARGAASGVWRPEGAVPNPLAEACCEMSEHISDDRLEAVADHVRQWLFGQEVR